MAFATALRVPIMGAARIAPAPARRNRATTTPRTARMNAVSALAPRPAPHYNSSGSSNGHRAAAAASRASRRLAAAAAAPAVRTPAALRSAAVAVEANLFARLARIARAAIQNFTAQFEDPERLLDTVVGEMGDDLVRMRQAQAAVLASYRQMEAKYRQAQGTADDWLRRAELAVSKGSDDLAREALVRRRGAEGAAAALKTQLGAQRRALDQLAANVAMLEAKLTEARNKRETLKSRAAAAKSSRAVQEMVAGLRLSSSTAWSAFDRMEERVVALEAEAEAAGVFATPDGLEAQFQQLEGGAGVDGELAALKLAAAGGGRALPGAAGTAAGTATAAAVGRPLFADALGIDAELEALRRRAAA